MQSMKNLVKGDDKRKKILTRRHSFVNFEEQKEEEKNYDENFQVFQKTFLSFRDQEMESDKLHFLQQDEDKDEEDSPREQMEKLQKQVGVEVKQAFSSHIIKFGSFNISAVIYLMLQTSEEHINNLFMQFYRTYDLNADGIWSRKEFISFMKNICTEQYIGVKKTWKVLEIMGITRPNTLQMFNENQDEDTIDDVSLIRAFTQLKDTHNLTSSSKPVHFISFKKLVPYLFAIWLELELQHIQNRFEQLSKLTGLENLTNVRKDSLLGIALNLNSVKRQKRTKNTEDMTISYRDVEQLVLNFTSYYGSNYDKEQARRTLQFMQEFMEVDPFTKMHAKDIKLFEAIEQIALQICYEWGFAQQQRQNISTPSFYIQDKERWRAAYYARKLRNKKVEEIVKEYCMNQGNLLNMDVIAKSLKYFIPNIKQEDILQIQKLAEEQNIQDNVEEFAKNCYLLIKKKLMPMKIQQYLQQLFKDEKLQVVTDQQNLQDQEDEDDFDDELEQMGLTEEQFLDKDEKKSFVQKLRMQQKEKNIEKKLMRIREQEEDYNKLSKVFQKSDQESKKEEKKNVVEEQQAKLKRQFEEEEAYEDQILRHEKQKQQIIMRQLKNETIQAILKSKEKAKYKTDHRFPSAEGDQKFMHNVFHKEIKESKLKDQGGIIQGMDPTTQKLTVEQVMNSFYQDSKQKNKDLVQLEKGSQNKTHFKRFNDKNFYFKKQTEPEKGEEDPKAREEACCLLF